MRRVLVADHDQDRAEAAVPGSAVELPEVQALGSRTLPTHNRRPRDYTSGCVSKSSQTWVFALLDGMSVTSRRPHAIAWLLRSFHSCADPRQSPGRPTWPNCFAKRPLSHRNG